MTADLIPGDDALTAELRVVLLALARREDECAADQAAAQPYWLACPPSVQGHRAAAVALREHADALPTFTGTVVRRLGDVR